MSKKSTNKKEPLYKGTIKVNPNKNLFVPLQKHIAALEKINEYQNEIIVLRNLQNRVPKKEFYFNINDYHPFTTSKNLALN